MRSFAIGCVLLAACAAPNPSRDIPAPERYRKSEDLVVEPGARAVVQSTGVENTEAVGPGDAGYGNLTEEALASDVLVATVAGEPIHVSTLLKQWHHHFSDEVLEHLDQLAISHIVLAEARRLGVTLAPEDVDAAAEAVLDEMRLDIQGRNPGMEIDDFIRDRLGMNAERYRARMRHHTIVRMLSHLVVRTWLMHNEHAFARLIAVATEEDMQVVQEALAAGESFASVAKRLSLEPDPEVRGRLVPVVREDSDMASMVFSTPAGSVGGPFERRGSFVLVEVVERSQPLGSNWPEMAGEVQASLERLPVDPLEYGQWTSAMRLRYKVDYGPFLRLVGELPPQ